MLTNDVLLAAAAATPLPTPLPVQIVGAEKADPFYVYALPVIGAVVAFCGLVVGVFGLYLIWLQIRRADLALLKADEQIDLAKRDLAKTAEALTIAQEQAVFSNTERAKIPDLYVTVNYERGTLTTRAGFKRLKVYLHNDGDKTAGGAAIQIFVPVRGITDRLDRLPQSTAQEQRAKLEGNPERLWPHETAEFKGAATYHFKKQVSMVIQGSVRFIGYLDVHLDAGTYSIGWHVIDDAGVHYPASGKSGTIELDVL